MSARYEGKTLVLVSLLAGFGIGALLSLSSARYTEGPAVAMAANPVLNVRSFVPGASVPALSRVQGPSVITGHNGPAFRGVQTFAETAEGPKIDAKTVGELRKTTGAGMMDCKKALVECNGDAEEAMKYLRQKGLATADKKGSRSTNEGIIESYVHNSKIGVIIEVSCETDFVAKTPEFKAFARDLAMQIAASPTVEAVSEADISPEFIAKEKEILSGAEDMKGKPPQIVEKMVEGRIAKIIKTRTLVDQPYIKNPDETVEEFIKTNIAKFGENIKVARFARFTVGGA